jgi:S-adenosylmethionine-diacylglycerol 3-amino-3-carboxypropyl transferase
MNELKFAVVREDPLIEQAVAQQVGARRALLVASGGCTAFALAEALPELTVELFDANPHQLRHVEDKAAAIARGDLAALNVEDPDPRGLNQRGAFERLFGVLRAAMDELVADAVERRAYFDGDAALARRWIAHRYWPAVFASAFHEPLLLAMFGPDAVQHAAPGSYPGYFQRRFELGLLRADGPRNPWLQLVLLGCHLARDVPAHLSSRRMYRFAAHPGGLLEVPGLERFDLVHLSNIFDWADDALVARWTQAARALAPGAAITLRQLNNARDLRWFLEPHFRVDEALSERLLAADRSLFYERVLVAFRVP